MANAPTYRRARLEDIEVMADIRNTVRENALVSAVIEHEDYVQAMTADGRAWVCELDGEVVGFACGRVVQGDIWALFMREDCEGQGMGGALLDLVERWMFSQGMAEIWLTTAPGTRAERLYQHRGWRLAGTTKSGEAEFRLRPPPSLPPSPSQTETESESPPKD